MAFALSFAGVTDGYVDIADVVVADGLGFYKEFDFEIPDYTNQALCAQSQTLTQGSVQIIAADQIRFRIAGGTRTTVTLTQNIPLNTRCLLRFIREYDGTRNIVILLNGVEVYRQNNASFGISGGIDTTGVIGKTFDGQFTGIMYAADINGSVYLNTNDPNSSTWGDGTLVNIPSTNWVEYGAGPASYTLTAETVADSHAANDVTLTFSGAGTAYTITCDPVSDNHLAGDATLNYVQAGVVTITLPPMYRNTVTLTGSVNFSFVNVIRDSDGANIGSVTGLSSNASSVLSFTDVSTGLALVAGTDYLVAHRETTGQFGITKVTAA